MISDRFPEVEPLLEKIARAQERAARDFRPVVAAPDDAASGGKPRLAPDRIEVDWDAFGRLLGELLDILSDWGGEETSTRVDAGEALALDDPGRRALLAACIEGSDALGQRAEALGLDAEVFALAVRYAFAPFLGACAAELRGGIDEMEDLSGRCPVCGAEPVVAEFDADDGHRRLTCGLCGTEWRFERLKCPFCGSDDQKRLGFLEVEGLEGCRADVCEACGRYLKTVDRRKVGSAAPLEKIDAVTPELDEAALSFLEERRQEAGKT